MGISSYLFPTLYLSDSSPVQQKKRPRKDKEKKAEWAPGWRSAAACVLVLPCPVPGSKGAIIKVASRKIPDGGRWWNFGRGLRSFSTLIHSLTMANQNGEKHPGGKLRSEASHSGGLREFAGGHGYFFFLFLSFDESIRSKQMHVRIREHCLPIST
ncbi:hypothetical protein LY76DRAFT_362238 [Colletotrichum caudatum]|nr:hypothetical protein LY76DRAFT_362238 [Colletotrichum caudatum]